MYYSEPVYFLYTFIIYISEANILTKIDLMKKNSQVLTYICHYLAMSNLHQLATASGVVVSKVSNENVLPFCVPVVAIT